MAYKVETMHGTCVATFHNLPDAIARADAFKAGRGVNCVVTETRTIYTTQTLDEAMRLPKAG